MDGLNENWEKYGCNMHDAIVGMAYNTSSGGLTYWVNSNGVKYAGYTLSSSAGLVAELNSSSVGVIYVIAPDRTFTKTNAPGFSGATYPFYYDLLDEGGCRPMECEPVEINWMINNCSMKIDSKFILNNSNLKSVNLIKDGSVSLKIIDIKGRSVKRLLNGYKKAGNYDIGFNLNSLSNGTYFINLKINDELSTKKVVVTK